MIIPPISPNVERFHLYPLLCFLLHHITSSRGFSLPLPLFSSATIFSAIFPPFFIHFFLPFFIHFFFRFFLHFFLWVRRISSSILAVSVPLPLFKTTFIHFSLPQLRVPIYLSFITAARYEEAHTNKCTKAHANTKGRVHICKTDNQTRRPREALTHTHRHADTNTHVPYHTRNQARIKPARKQAREHARTRARTITRTKSESSHANTHRRPFGRSATSATLR